MWLMSSILFSFACMYSNPQVFSDLVLKLDEVLLSRQWLELCRVGNRLPVGLIDGHRILLQKDLQAVTTRPGKYRTIA
jgi:hypothetical protein